MNARAEPGLHARDPSGFNRPCMNFCSIARLGGLSLALIAGLLSGCSTPTHRVTPDAPVRTSTLRKIVILPLDVEVSELSAGGMTEKRDDWTRAVTDNLNTALSRLGEGRFTPLTATVSEAELQDIQALFRSVSINQILHRFYGPPLLDSVHKTLDYRLGSLDAVLEPAGADAALVLFVRDDYATSGRKAVAVVGILAGLPVRAGVTISSAALVARDGSILWMNQIGATTGDLRTQGDADDTVEALFTGLPAFASP